MVKERFPIYPLTNAKGSIGGLDWFEPLVFVEGKWETAPSPPNHQSKPALGAKLSRGPDGCKTTCLKGKLGPPVVPFYPFLGEGSPTNIDYRKKRRKKERTGTFILTSLLEDGHVA